MTKQINKPLDDLFVRLQMATNVEDAQQIEDSICKILFHYDGENRHINYLMNRVVSAMESERFEHAEVLCSTVIELAPEFVEGWNRRATVRYLAGDIDGSIADVNATLSLEPRHFGALSGLGLCFLALENLEKAADMLRRVLAIHPFAAGAKNNLTEIENVLGYRNK